MSQKTAFPKAIALFTLPDNPTPSTRFRGRFNDVAKELHIGLEWIRDEKDPLAVNAEELKIAATDLKKYKVTEPTPKIFNDALVADVKKILTEVEHQRLKKVEESAMWREIITFQAAGDLNGFLAWSKQLVDAIPNEADQLILKANEGVKPTFIERHL